jgi:large subunit ribosomal protein L22
MEIKASAKHIKMSPRKVRLVVNLVRGSQVDKALDQLKFTKKLAVGPVAKVITSAVASATNTYSLERGNLFVKTITVDEGQTLDRWMPKAHGRATPIRKRTCHINVIISEIKDSGTVRAKEQKLEAPIKLGEKPAIADKKLKTDKSEHAEHNPEDELEKGVKGTDMKSKPGRGGHAPIEGGKKGFVGKMFNRKTG